MRTTNNLAGLLLAIFLLNGCTLIQKKESNTKNPTIFKTKKEERAYLKAYNKALTLWPVSYEEVDIKTSFGTAHVIISGPKDGPPLVLLHGMNASSTMWYPNIKSFAERHRVYAIDFILEPGKSISKGEIKDKDEIVAWYNELFDHLKLEKVSIVGASRGGWLALLLATHPRGRIKNIVLLSPAQSFTFIDLDRSMFSNILFMISPKRKKLRKSLQSFSCNVDKIKQAFIDQYYIAIKNTRKNSSILQMTPFSEEELQSLRIPVLLLIGDNDNINDKESVEKARKLVPNIKAEIIPQAGHFLSIDQAETVNQKIITFLNTNK